MTSRLIIHGPRRLKGTVKTSGAKNSALALIPAALLSNEPVIIRNIPFIRDVCLQLQMLEQLGAKVTILPGNEGIEIDSSSLSGYRLDYKLAKKLRASYYFLGALMGKLWEVAEVPLPGGCDIGHRPIDQHLKGFSAQGISYSLEGGIVRLEKCREAGDVSVYFDVVSVGATVNQILTAVLRRGKTVIENAAKEPEIVDLANFLAAMGANVRGAGTDIIRIEGVESLHGIDYQVIPDRIEAGSYLFGVAATGGEITVTDVIPKHLEPVTAKLREMGMDVEEGDDFISLNCPTVPRPLDVKTLPYPGFPTDLQPLIMSCLIKAPGISIITENVFENRFRHVEEYKKMGANVRLEGRSAIIEGSTVLRGAPLRATDLRAGAAMIFAAIAAEGDSSIDGVEHIYRGYEGIEKKLISLGAVIEGVEENNREDTHDSEKNPGDLPGQAWAYGGQ